MTTPAPASPTNFYGTIMAIPSLSVLFGNSLYSSIFNDPENQSIINSVVAQYSDLLDGLAITTTGTAATATGAGITSRPTKPSAVTGQPVRTGTTTVYETVPPSPGGGAPIGAIVGGVVGGVLALVLLGVLIFCCRRRRKAMTERDFLIDDEHQLVHQVNPYQPATPQLSHPPLHPPQPYNNDPKGIMLSSGEASLTSGYQSGYTSSYAPASGSFSAPSASSTSPYADSVPAPTKVPPTSAPAPLVEHAVDAGSVPVPSPAPNTEILPPMYDPSWSDAQRR
ncbi:hypothetical protein CC85DRAFT_138296 [Cutaneotrichosporon oleaginosum]|uniref:receptor protein-tyrosine kinase n=1 Tax=Cutaneotrichosporon oleaginosum TaxID=879819 RepID=A0A0J0XIM8_9TREE|nr:uncharacterized protein CC85DRAFT_138296 [Cutaneotrichosporon oleaginosum]KLT40928.1 hypothetical protein CC85DRAFT_138296 [Cutaneotrichosporon oleaginosum]TXT15421.1 hypothetical protein COLE_01614 [Cutaneotrichosporon oleaginosum]